MPCGRPAAGRTRQERPERADPARRTGRPRHHRRQPPVQPRQWEDGPAGARTGAGPAAVGAGRGAHRRPRHRERRGAARTLGRPGQTGPHRRPVPPGGRDAPPPRGGLAARPHAAAVRGERRQPRLSGLLRPGGDPARRARLRHGGRGQTPQVPHRLRSRPPGRRHQDRHRRSRRVRRGGVPRERRTGQPRRRGAADLGPPRPRDRDPARPGARGSGRRPLHDPVMAHRPDTSPHAGAAPHHHVHEHPDGTGAMAHSHS